MSPAKLKVLTFILMSLFSLNVSAKNYVVFNIKQDVPMGEPGEIIKKNFYLNMGLEQGLKEGSVVEVYRNLSRQDPYNTKKRFHYKIKVAELEVIHSEDSLAIANLKEMSNTAITKPLVDIQGVMIGDRIEAKTN